jgi:hypothetical protein
MNKKKSLVSHWRLAFLGAVLCAWTSSAQQVAPKSGALIALDTGQTLWIASVNGKIQVIAADDYVIPRKDGFWRVRLEFRPLTSSEQETGNQGIGTGNGIQGQLWAVPLEKGMDVVPWDEPPATNDNQKSEEVGEEHAERNMRGDEGDELHRRELHFLSPDHISFFTQWGEYSETYSILKIDDEPAKQGHDTEVLRVYGEDPPIPEDARVKDLEACVDPQNELATEEFLKGAYEVTYGIERGRGKWYYTWLLGYSGGAARGYHTGCAVSVLPPKSLVGRNELFPGWNAIKDVYPDAEDAFSSPAHDLILVLYQNRLMVAPLQGGKVGKPLARLEVNGKPVMVEWALGKYVDAWTKELTPYFGAYKPKAKTVQQ